MVASPSGDLYLIDPSAYRIAWLGPDGKLLRIVGGWGEGEDEFQSIGDAAVSRDLEVYVTDPIGRKVVVFDRRLNPLKTLTVGEDAGISRPMFIGLTDLREIVLVDEDDWSVTTLDGSGTVLGAIGGDNDPFKLGKIVQMEVGENRRVAIIQESSSFLEEFTLFGKLVRRTPLPAGDPLSLRFRDGNWYLMTVQGRLFRLDGPRDSFCEIVFGEDVNATVTDAAILRDRVAMLSRERGDIRFQSLGSCESGRP